MKPTQIKKTDDHALLISWDDGHAVTYTLKFLRDECPCAGCRGETLLFGKTLQPMQLPIFQPGMFDLKKLELVGNYAMQVAWGDGHDTGIYSWEYLLQLEIELNTKVTDGKA